MTRSDLVEELAARFGHAHPCDIAEGLAGQTFRKGGVRDLIKNVVQSEIFLNK